MRAVTLAIELWPTRQRDNMKSRRLSMNRDVPRKVAFACRCTQRKDREREREVGARHARDFTRHDPVRFGVTRKAPFPVLNYRQSRATRRFGKIARASARAKVLRRRRTGARARIRAKQSGIRLDFSRVPRARARACTRERSRDVPASCASRRLSGLSVLKRVVVGFTTKTCGAHCEIQDRVFLRSLDGRDRSDLRV